MPGTAIAYAGYSDDQQRTVADANILVSDNCYLQDTET